MAIFYFRTTIIKASSGKSAVASAAYMSGEKLYSERLGKTFSYANKKEVVYSEVFLPENAPKEFQDRNILWQNVEKYENKANSRYARNIVIAIPEEFSREQGIEVSREFIQKGLVSQGCAVDFAYHDKKGNPHIHIMCTCRGFNPDGSWKIMQRKEFALDENGERIPEIDKKTGEQKIRIHKKNGKEYQEKVWKRITVQVNPYNSREFLNNVKKCWAETCNQYLEIENHIDHRSYVERGLNRIPMLHEGPEARAADERGETVDVIEENKEIKSINQKLAQFERFIREARRILEELKKRLELWREIHGKKRSIRTNAHTSRDGAIGDRISGFAPGDDGRDGTDTGKQAVEHKYKRCRRH